MIDLNTIITQALTAAVYQAVAPLNERIATLEKNEEYLTNRIAVLENNPAQGVEPAITIDEARMVEALNSQEWFWEKLQNRIDASVEQSMDLHLECHDHDNYDEMASKVYETDFDDFVKTDYLEDAVREAVSNLSFDISVS